MGEVETLSFEQAFRELEGLVERLEGGEVGLEESLRTFERGLVLHKVCQRALEDAEARVEILTRREGALATEPFAPDEG